MRQRLHHIYTGLKGVIAEYSPTVAAIEEVFVNTNARSSLKLGQARGIALLVCQEMGMKVEELATRAIKKAVVGAGKADKQQVQLMVKHLLPGVDFKTADAADALAVAICHAHLRTTSAKWEQLGL